MIGTRLSHYLIEEKIGEGGMGVVYKARDTRLLRHVAIKILPAHLVSRDRNRKRLVQEARTASALNHPNICTVHDIGEEKGVHFIVMEFLEGQTLREILEARGQLPENEVIEIAAKVCDALTAAHSKGIIHRDIKPDNIMVTREGVVKVMDFGLAKLLDGKDVQLQASAAHSLLLSQNLLKTSVSTFQGTATYMSPEQIEKRKMDGRTDVFSIGVLLYELLTGVPPFAGRDSVAVMKSILKDEPKPVTERVPDISPEVDAAVMKALGKRPVERHTSASAFREVLQNGTSKNKKTDPHNTWQKFLDLTFRSRKSWLAVSTTLIIVLSLAFYFAKAFNTSKADITTKPKTRTYPIVTSRYNDNFSAISPDGQRAAYASDRSGNRDIGVRELGSSEAWNLTRVWDGGISGAENPSNPNGVRNLKRSWELEAGFDLDDDGLKEFAAYDATDGVLWVWENTALGMNDYTAVYTIPAPAPMFSNDRSILITDMDHDGNKELVVIWDSFAPGTPNGFDALQVYEHIPGSGDFLPATPQLTFDPPRNLDRRIDLEFESQAGDFDLDGNVELLLTYRAKNNLLIAVLEFEGDDIASGSFNIEFIDGDAFPADVNQVHGLSVGELNGDGRPDFVMVVDSRDSDPVEIRVYTTTGTDTWSMTVFDDTVLPQIYVTARGSNATPAIADFNGDGFNEVYLIGRGKIAEDPSNKPRLWVVSPVGGGFFDLATAFNAANFTDLQVAEIVPPPAQNKDDLRGGFVADGDNDGRLEVYILSRDLTTIFATEWVGNPSGNVTDPSNYQTTALYNSKDFTPGLNVQFSNIKVLDLDGDGPNHMDIVFVSPTSEHEGLESSIFVLEYNASELPPPDISVSPDSLSEDLFTGEAATDFDDFQ